MNQVDNLNFLQVILGILLRGDRQALLNRGKEIIHGEGVVQRRSLAGIIRGDGGAIRPVFILLLSNLLLSSLFGWNIFWNSLILGRRGGRAGHHQPTKAESYRDNQTLQGAASNKSEMVLSLAVRRESNSC